MQTIPSINCTDFACAEGEVKLASGFLPKGGWLHLDVADGVFTFHKSWSDPAKFKVLLSGSPQFSWEVHLMVERPETVAGTWLAAGAKRLIVPLETITPESAATILAAAKAHGALVMLSSNPETKSEALRPYLGTFSEFQVLAVTPGWSGQQFLPIALDKVKFIRENRPDAVIEVDGGMNPGTAERVKALGANQVIAASYVFDAADKKVAFHELEKV